MSDFVRTRPTGLTAQRNIVAETRQDRATRVDKNVLEKTRLTQRREKYTRYTDLGVVTQYPPGSLGYMTGTLSVRILTNRCGKIPNGCGGGAESTQRRCYRA
jgi:hypothetical protein